MRCFAMQYRSNPPYRALCDRRGISPRTVRSWREIPAVPTAAFQSVELACASPEAEFRTSGTTRGAGRRGRHLVPRLELYRRSAVAHFRHMVLPDGVRPRFLGLLAGPTQLPHSSLSRMVDWLATDVGDGPARWLVDVGLERFDPAAAVAAIEDAGRDLVPLCLIGVRAVFTRLLDHLAATAGRVELPPDSRIVDTGGPKGGRTLSDGGFLAACWSRLGVAGYHNVNEYGMTELCSQFYDDVLRARFDGSNASRVKRGPAWTRTVAVDPETLEPVPDGEPGILRHLDLANAGSVVAVQTEDLGVLAGSAFRLLGRLPGAEARGCALALAEILAGQEPAR